MKKITLLLLCALCTIAAQAAGSGIYLRGEVNSWSTQSEWEFQTTDADGVYILENKTVKGAFKIASDDFYTYCYGAPNSDNPNVPALGVTYTLTSGTESKNIDLGTTTYECSKIVLAISNGNATIRFDAKEGTTSGVYVKVDGTMLKETSAIKIWAWDDTTSYTSSSYVNRPYMTLKTAADGTKYFYCEVQTTGAFKCKFSFDTSYDTIDLDCNGSTAFSIESITHISTIDVPTAWAEPTVNFYGESSSWEDQPFTYDADNDCYYYTITATSNLTKQFLVKIDGTTLSSQDYIGGTIKADDTYKVLGASTYGNNMAITNAELYASATIYVAKLNGIWTMKIVPGAYQKVQLRYGGTIGNFTYNADNGYFTYPLDNASALSSNFFVLVGDGDSQVGMKAESYVKAALSTDDTTYKEMKVRDASEADMYITNTDNIVSATVYVMFTDSKWSMKIVPTTIALASVEGGSSWNDKTFTRVSKTENVFVCHVETDIEDFEKGFGINYGGKTLTAYGTLLVGEDTEYKTLHEDTECMYISTTADGVYIYLKLINGKWSIRVLAEEATSGIADVDAAGVKISAEAGEIVVEGAQKVAVYTAGGALVSTDARTKAARGLYIVRADNQVKKVIVK